LATGRLQRGDQLLESNGISLMGVSNERYAHADLIPSMIHCGVWKWDWKQPVTHNAHLGADSVLMWSEFHAHTQSPIAIMNSNDREVVN